MPRRIIGTIVLTIGLAVMVQAQAPSVFTAGLQLPTKIVTAGQSSLLVAETGFANNNGRISLVDRSTGVRRTLIEGLPSSLNIIENSRSGISGLNLRGLKLYVTVGQGDSAIRDGRGTTVANPDPVTPLNNSILELTLPAGYEELTAPFALTFGDQTALAAGSSINLANGAGGTLAVRMVANLPDYKAFYVTGFGFRTVRPANLFGIASTPGDLYVVDASFNLLYKVNPATGAYAVLATFSPVENPLPFGAPLAEPVPDSVRLLGGQLLITQLVGFPFAPGTSSIVMADVDDGSLKSLLRGLTSAMDIIPVPLSGAAEAYYVLEFSTNMLQNPAPPGRLRLFIDETDPITVASTLIAPTSMARDGDTGDIYITEIFPGRITRIPGTFDPTNHRSR